MGIYRRTKTQQRPPKNLTMPYTFACRLCRRPISPSEAIQIGPFPKAAQYYPEPDEFETEVSAMLDIVECAGCGLTQLMNAPVDYYKQVITAASLSPVVREQRLSLFQQLRIEFPASSLSSPTLHALEIGCAAGDNLPLLREVGFTACGIEFSPPESAAPLTKRNGADGISNQYILDLGTECDEKFDLLVSFNYLEHQPDARAFLEKCHRMLTPEGRLLLTVPNLTFLLASESGHEFVTDHLVYFTANSLETALRITGFELQELKIINNQYDIQIIARKRAPTSSIVACKAALDGLVTSLNEKLRNFANQGQKVAVWGAGHRTLALISLSEHALIHCIIDSAQFKHHKFAPISHLEILPPETLLDATCGIDVILVMVPGIYPKEVIHKIKSLPIQFHAEQFPPEI
jgi:2-polyprenyl-3-methyl-5-hydroxy-6-metoxy-1,4-benzoquinol methylase